METKKQENVVSLNAPKLEIHGIEEFENRLEMKKFKWPTSNMCSSSWYGKC